MTKKTKKPVDEAQAKMERFKIACEAAAFAQVANKDLRATLAKATKKEQAALKADMVADLLRVFEHPDNPFSGFAASRARYRQLGHYPEILIHDVFGNHAEFQRAAGLHDTRNTTKVQNKAALLHSAQKVAEYAEREIKPYHGAYNKTRSKDHFEIVIGSDFHSKFVDPFALRVYLDVIKMVDPTHVRLNGDVTDFPQISRHRSLPGHFNLNLQTEIDFAREHIIKASREAAPNADLKLVIGNHEARLVNYIADTAPALASLRSLRIGDLFGLDDFECGLVCRSNFLNPYAAQKKRDVMENYEIIADCFVVTHGSSIATFASQEQLKRFQKSGTSGHTHRPQLATGNSLGTGAISWMSTPMMASHAVGRDYVQDHSAWNMGFGVVSINVPKKLVSQQLVIVHEEWATFGGKTWHVTDAERKARAALKEV